MASLHKKKLYNATFVYDDKDLPWVKCAAQYLEENYEKSVYYRGRDATPGHRITDNSINSITNTEVIVVAISKAFLNNFWAKKEEDWALLDSVKTDGCKLLPVLLEDCDIPKELSDLEALNLTSMAKCEEEHLEQLGKGLHQLLANGQICQRAKSMLHPDRYLNGPELYHNGTLAGNNTTTTSDNESNDQGLPVMPYDLQCLLTLLNILACKLVAMSINSINILDSCIRDDELAETDDELAETDDELKQTTSWLKQRRSDAPAPRLETLAPCIVYGPF
ncbi:hypothetical protein Bbelb_225120 [Branchiostoma belcheri]|nr:hypothetical protein Bbelb_225120 [Branchiostoma belcheri]